MRSFVSLLGIIVMAGFSAALAAQNDSNAGGEAPAQISPYPAGAAPGDNAAGSASATTPAGATGGESTASVPVGAAGSWKGEPDPNSTAPTTPMLFGSVTHSDNMAHVANALDKHRKAVQPKGKLETAKADKADVIASVPTSLQGVAKQNGGYVPMTGVAQETSDTTKSLSAEVKKYTLEWFMIPSWLAGKWEKAGDLTVSITDLQTGQQTFPNEWTENEQESTWGHQRDAAGNVWHVNFLPAEKDGKSDGKSIRFLTVMQKCEKTDVQGLITRTQYVVSESNFWTGQPIDMFQQESLNHYMLTPQHEVVNNSTNRVFSYDGKPVRDGHLQTKFSKTQEFVATPAINGIDLKLALNDYLEEHGLKDLMNK